MHALHPDACSVAPPPFSQALIKRFVADSPVKVNDLVSLVNSTSVVGRGAVASGFGVQVSTPLGSGSLPNATDLGTRALFNLSSTVAVLAYLDVNSLGAFAVFDPASCVPKVRGGGGCPPGAVHVGVRAGVWDGVLGARSMCLCVRVCAVSRACARVPVCTCVCVCVRASPRP